jgi:hypothetical protein
MNKATMEFLSDRGQYFTETWHFTCGPPDVILKRIAEVRRIFLSDGVQIVLPKIDGKPQLLRGLVKDWTSPQEEVYVRDAGYNTQHAFRGVPRSMVQGGEASPELTRALARFNEVLRQCGAVVTRQGKPVSVTELQFWSVEYLKAIHAKPTTKVKILRLLGAELGEPFWEKIKGEKHE